MCSKILESPLVSVPCSSLKNDASGSPAPFQFRPYQMEIGRAVMASVYQKQGLTFSVEIARQGGKNELSARIELLLMTGNAAVNSNLIKCSPTFNPQTVLSMTRLIDLLRGKGFDGMWEGEHGNIVRLGNARAIFLSADKHANVVGNTAHLLLEVDEAQDVDKEKYSKDFKPMGSTTNVTKVLKTVQLWQRSIP